MSLFRRSALTCLMLLATFCTTVGLVGSLQLLADETTATGADVAVATSSVPAASTTAGANTARSLTAREFDWPESPWVATLWVAIAILAVLWVVMWYRRDGAALSSGWTWLLTALRLMVWAGVLLIALNPHDRTQRMSYRPSQVAILVDTSLSMRHPAQETTDTSTAEPGSRAAAVQQLLANPTLLESLRRQHEVSLYTFDSSLSAVHQTWPTLHPGLSETSHPETTPQAEAKRPTTDSLDWNGLLEPRGLETRLGEALSELIRTSGGRSLSGIVLITDGASNAGVEAISARDMAVATKTRLVTIGTGTTTLPTNLFLVDVQSPSEVQKGDEYEISAFVQGQGLGSREVTVELLELGAETAPTDAAITQSTPNTAANPPTVLETRTVLLTEEASAAEVKFTRKPAAAGATRYAVQVVPPAGLREANPDDNQQQLTVTVFDRPTRVLLVAGGPMRDYQFVRNLMFRHKSIDIDIFLQTASAGTSQESNELLSAFPTTREQLFEYDVVIAFDPDWQAIPAAALTLLSEWVFQEAGGLILVAGDVHTPVLAQGAGAISAGEAGTDPLQPLRQLYPVVLGSYYAASRFDVDATQPWPIAFTSEGQSAGFLQLTDDTITSAARWKEFTGIYRCYPTVGQKAGAIVYARSSDPRAQPEPPILMAAQFFGQGRVFYLGSPEMWRLRSTSEDDYDRFWIKTTREVGQGRLKRGTRRGLLMPDARRFVLGQTARIRARLLDARYQPLATDSVALEVYDPAGRPLVPARQLLADTTRPGEFVGELRLTQPGAYRLELAIPDSREFLRDELMAALPRLEDEDIRQNQPLLEDLAKLSGGVYLPLEAAAGGLAAALPHQGEPFLVDERLRTLWDRGWVMYLLVGLLGTEWLIRKLLKLA